MAGVQFTGGSGRGGNQAWNQIERVQQNQRSNTYADIAAQNADQNDIKFRQSQNVDAAMRQGIPQNPTGPNAEGLRALKITPGGAEAAQKTMESDKRDADTMGRHAMMALTDLSKPENKTIYEYWNGKHREATGRDVVPPEVAKDAAASALYSRGFLTAERIYRNDPPKALRFVKSFMEHGNMAQAFAETGAPADKPHFTQIQLEQEGKRTLAAFDPNSGTVRIPRDAKGAPYEVAGRAGTGNGGSETALINMLRAAGLGAGEAFQAINTLKRGADPERTFIETYNTLLPKLVSSLGAEEGELAARKAAEAMREVARSAALYQLGRPPGSTPAPVPALSAPQNFPSNAAQGSRPVIRNFNPTTGNFE